MTGRCRGQRSKNSGNCETAAMWRQTHQATEALFSNIEESGQHRPDLADIGETKEATMTAGSAEGISLGGFLEPAGSQPQAISAWPTVVMMPGNRRQSRLKELQ